MKTLFITTLILSFIYYNKDVDFNDNSNSCYLFSLKSLPPVIQPESLNIYFFKGHKTLANMLKTNKFILTSEKTSSENLHSSVYSSGSQKIEIVSYNQSNPSGKEQIISIKSLSDESYLFNEEMSKDKVVYLMETRHTDLLKVYGFKLLKTKSEKSEDDEIYMYKGNQIDGSYIECRFFTDGEFLFTIEFYNPESD